MGRLEVHQFICRSDNFGVLLHDPETGATASIDAPEAAAIRRELANKGWRLTHILVTHHHGDHTEGIAPLKSETGCKVIGPKAEAAKIQGLDELVAEGDTFELAGHRVNVIDTPGHTAGHISYVLPDQNMAFVGDTLFVMGCGRIIEGDPEMMWHSLQKIARLPKSTDLYCGHEYTVANAQFALTIEPGNEKLIERTAQVTAMRARNALTQPTRVDIELETNPFLRPHVPAIRERLGMKDKKDWEVFAEIRERKNRS
ncbi:MAG: hydroxyacylglutathione hydrolase [Hyphomicrobiaceae bacterium]